ncbi:MAG: hypothetical protein RL011_1313 [Pseudomonadota bacterium]|jgi:hypothetical protein
MNMRCIKHPEYRGKTSPVLACRTCCSMFLAENRIQKTHDGGGSIVPPPPSTTKSSLDARETIIQTILQSL